MVNTNQTAFFIAHLQKHASKYYRGFDSDQACVHLVDKQERRMALLYHFHLSNKVQAHSVFVKVFRYFLETNQTRPRAYEKPLLYPTTDPRDRHRLHYVALSAIHDYFTDLNQESLGAIRVLDYLPQCSAVITEGSRDIKLRQLFWRKNRLYSPFPNDQLAPVFQNTGTWLKLYHNMPKEDATTSYACREDYIESIIKLNNFLIKTVGDKSFFEQASATIINKAQTVLPGVLPLGLAHGDFAQRNILIGPKARVTVLDTYAHWRAPIYHDIGYFLNDLKMAYPQRISRGFAFVSNPLMAYEQAFLQGYFGQEPVPYSAIRLYEVLALLDKWSSAIAKSYQRSKSIKSVRQLFNGLMNHPFKRGVRSLLDELAKVELAVTLWLIHIKEVIEAAEIMEVMV